jgi:hypothetical protein
MSQLLDPAGDTVVKCAYFNEINKDELPRPNFVSSVKSLFERQIAAASTSHESAQPSPTASRQLQPPLTPQTRPELAVSTPVDACSQPHSPEAVIESLVDRMKHNGTLVYDHTDCKRLLMLKNAVSLLGCRG